MELFCKVSPNHDHIPHTGMKAASAVLIVSTLTRFSVCAPVIAAFVFTVQSKHFMLIYDTMYAFLVSVRVVSASLLCVLVCKVKLRAQTQTHTELNTDHQSV